MKFDRSEKLCDFLQKNQIFPHMTSIKEIYAGGSSYNFYVETHENKFFLKLLVSQKSYLQIKSILTQLNFIYWQCLLLTDINFVIRIVHRNCLKN